MSARNEQLLQALLSGEALDMEPQSRTEEYLLNLLNGEKPTRAPVSRQDALLAALAEKGLGGGSGGGYTIEDFAQANNAIQGELLLDCKVTRGWAFHGCANITKVTLGKGYIGSYSTAVNNIFGGCGGLTEVDATEEIDALTSTGFDMNPSMFAGCANLKKVRLRKFYSGSSGFRNCTNLESFDDSCYRMMGDSNFENCNKLKIFIHRHNEVVPLHYSPSIWAFQFKNTPFDPNWAKATGGYVLVPSALTAEYPSATNWSTIYEAGLCTFLPLEEYTVDGTTTGEINWDKLNAIVYAEVETT